MKNNIKRLMSLMMCVALLFAMGVPALATDTPEPEPAVSTVTFDDENGFIFSNADSSGHASGKDWGSTTDLFASSDFKNVFPGDSIDGSFRIATADSNDYSYRLYLHAKVVDEAYESLLKNMTLTVNGETDDEGNESWLYKLFAALGIVEQVDGESENVQYNDGDAIDKRILLGTFAPGKSADFDLQLHVSEEMGNDFQNAYGEIVWVFTFEQIIPPVIVDPDPDPDPEPTDKPALNREDHFGYIIGRGNGGVQPQAEITRAEVATIFFRMLTDDSRAEYWSQENPFSDVSSNSWYNNAISTLYNSGVVDGYPDGSFRPNSPITRAEFAVIATRFYDVASEYDTDAFNDISEHWARNYINHAAELGIISGYEDGSYHPSANIIRAEAMQLVNNVLERTPHKDSLLPDMLTWVDNMNTEMWYYAAVQEATNSHDYKIDDATGNEIWTEILPVRDWNALEDEWSTAYSD